MFANSLGFICIGSSSGIKGVVSAPGCHLQGVTQLIPTGTAEPYLPVLGELNLNADERAPLVHGQSGLLPFSVCSHIVFGSWPIELLALLEVLSEMSQSIQSSCMGLQECWNPQGTSVPLKWQVDPWNACRSLRCLYLSGPGAGHFRVCLAFPDYTKWQDDSVMKSGYIMMHWETILCPDCFPAASPDKGGPCRSCPKQNQFFIPTFSRFGWTWCWAILSRPWFC